MKRSSSGDSIIALEPVNDGFWDDKPSEEKLLEKKLDIVDDFWD